MSQKALLLFALLLCSIGALAQNNELAITGGGNFPRNNSYDSDTSFAVGGYFAHRVLHLPLISLYGELPVVAAPKSVMQLPTRNNYSALFVTPGLKLKFGSELPISPYIAVGGGFARYHQDARPGVADDTSTHGVVDYGAGIDWKVAPFFSFRAEVRDFYSGAPNLTDATRADRQHNIIPQLGLVFRF